MGMFFPTGIRALAPRPAFVPWAWAANGCASVVGTVVAVMLALPTNTQAQTAVINIGANLQATDGFGFSTAWTPAMSSAQGAILFGTGSGPQR